MNSRILSVLLSLIPSVLPAKVVIEAKGELAADTRDPTGDTVGGIGSGLIYDSATDTFLCIADRGGDDGKIPFRPRFFVLKIDQSGDKLEPRVIESVLFRDEQGREMSGLIPDDPDAPLPRMKDGRTCLDPEAIALAPDGTLYVADEYGPYLYQFRRDGKMMRRLGLPPDFQPRNAAGKLDFTDSAQLVSGRDINQGAEGMCLLPDGRSAAMIFQSGLVQDGRRSSAQTRIVFLDLETGKPTASHWYRFADKVPGTETPLDLSSLSVNDMVYLDTGRFLILERDKSGRDGSKSGELAIYKSVWVIDVRVATNTLIEKTADPVPVQKTFLFNLPALVADPARLAAKWEGLALLPSSDPQSITLMMTADNDFLTPLLHENGQTYPFPKAQDSVPAQFFKIRADLP